jgi:hypothetical protein
MEKQAIKELIYGGISEMMQNRRYFYRSSVGRSYSHWTEEGKASMDEFMKEMTQFIYDAEETALDNRAKDLVLKELKK